MMWCTPAMERRLAIILAVMAPRIDFRLLCREYGKYGITAEWGQTRCPSEQMDLILTRDLVCGTTLAGGNHDAQFNDIIIDLGTATLNHEHIFVTDRASYEE